jgi:HEPN domain-containing protein
MSIDDHLLWVRYAEQDWQLAVSLLRRKHLLTVAICFHAQQGAEKYLKALLISRQLDIPEDTRFGNAELIVRAARNSYGNIAAFPGAVVRLRSCRTVSGQ